MHESGQISQRQTNTLRTHQRCVLQRSGVKYVLNSVQQWSKSLTVFQDDFLHDPFVAWARFWLHLDHSTNCSIQSHITTRWSSPPPLSLLCSAAPLPLLLLPLLDVRPIFCYCQYDWKRLQNIHSHCLPILPLNNNIQHDIPYTLTLTHTL